MTCANRNSNGSYRVAGDRLRAGVALLNQTFQKNSCSSVPIRSQRWRASKFISGRQRQERRAARP